MIVHLVRHGRVASHSGDIPITEAGHAEVRVAGLALAELVQPGEEVHFLHSPSIRAQQTVDILYATMKDNLGQGVQLQAPRVEPAIRNPDHYLAGCRVELVSTPESMAVQIPDSCATIADVDSVPFYHAFFREPDRVGYWLNHRTPPGEDTRAVARRIVAFCLSLLDVPSKQKKRFVCVTHSPVLRAVLVQYLNGDPGEPAWVERIDLKLDPGGSAITFRDFTAPLQR